jgi:hypothetical protein
MYQFTMTDEEVKRTKAAVRLVPQLGKGEQLYKGITIGEALLKGRAHAMNAVRVNRPQGRAYAEAFSEWKAGFKWPTGKENEALYDAAITCAEHRSITESIIASLDLKKRVELGIFGLAVRVRRKVKELEGEDQPPRRKPGPKGRDELAGRLDDVEERLTAARAENPFNYWEKSPVEVARILVRANPAAAQKLARSIDEAHARRAAAEEGDC